METTGSIEQLKDPGVGFPIKPRLVNDIDIFIMPDGLGIQVRGAKSPVVLRGQLSSETEPWLKLLDGSRTLEDLLDACPPDFSKAQAARVLLVLFTKGLIVGGEPPDWLKADMDPRGDEVLRRQLLLWGRKIGIAKNHNFAEEVQQRLRTTKIALIGSGLFGTAAFDILHRSGCNNIHVADWSDDGLMASTVSQVLDVEKSEIPSFSRSIDDASRWLRKVLPTVDLLVTATRTAPDSLFQAINRLALGHRCRWLRGNDDGTNIEIGPFVYPFRSACFACVALRRASAAEYAIEEELYQQHLSDDVAQLHNVGVGESLANATAGGAMLSAEAIRIITAVSPPTALDTVLTLSFGGTFESDRFLRVPRCPECYSGKTNTTLETTKEHQSV